jgi:tetratricopeptide (TPR) repeat protein
VSTAYKYRAFISYSHGDEKWARWLHRSLETYRLPKGVVGRETGFGPVPHRFQPVFRDREELATATNLGATLVAALEQSASQIVICSPKSAKSRWVNEEILTFKRLGREDRIFALIVDGEPGSSLVPGQEEQECFPRALIYRMGADGELTAERGEPIAADVRPRKDRPYVAMLKLLAGMLGIGLDELMRRDAIRRRRRMVALVAASFAGMLITSGLAVTAWLARNEAERQRVIAEDEAETARQTTQFMVGLFQVSDPSEARGNTITAREILDKGVERIDSELSNRPAIQATLMDTMGSVYTGLGLYPEAIPLMRRALERRKSLPGGDTAMSVAQTQSNLGEALSLSSDYAEAARMLQEALEIQRRALGPRAPEVAKTLTRLADVYEATGEYEKAEPLIQQALRIRRRAYGELHPAVAESIADLGVIAGDRDDFKGAEVYLRQALEMQRQLQKGKGAHPLLAEALNNLAWALNGLGRPAEAEPLYREALEMKRKLYPDGHIELASGLNNLAFTREMLGDYRGAESAYREALAMNRKRLQKDSSPEIAANLSNLAFVLYAKGDRREAVDMLRQSLDMNRREETPNLPTIAGGATALAYWLIDVRGYDEAERLVQESLAIRRKTLGENSPQVAGTLTVEANLLLAQRRYAEARKVAAQARSMLAAALPEDHWQVAMAMNAEGAALAGLGNYDKAESLLLESLPRLAGSPLPGLEKTGRSRLARLYTEWGKPEKAGQYQAAN